MANATQPRSPTRPKQKKPSWAGNLKLCLRTVGSTYDKPFSTYADGRHKGDYEKELDHCMKIKTRFDNNPKYGDVEWAAIYDVSSGYDRGPKIFEFWLDKGRWQQIIG